jgi:hypothetical protein
VDNDDDEDDDGDDDDYDMIRIFVNCNWVAT